ncbi:MAG: uracil-DNA glycosylase family protein [Gaiellales bacterium]
MATNDISERYLKKAIAEINDLGAELSRAAGPDRTPVLGSGHPLADVFLLKYGPQAAEFQEGVAFFGRAGQAILKSMQRLSVDPTAIYGTNCVKYLDQPDGEAYAFLTRELHIVQPKLVVVMGEDARQCLNAIRFPLATEVEDAPGVLQRLTPTIDALLTPDIDASLDDQASKRAFWEAFKALGPWWSVLPPY